MEPFVELKFDGKRFAGGRLPVELLSDLAIYREIVVDVAKQVWRDKNRSRQRLPRGFDEHFHLSLTEIRDGSAVAILPRETANLSGLFAESEIGDIFSLAQEKIVNDLKAANESRPLNYLNETAIKKFGKFGRGLLEHESILLSSKTAGATENVKYTPTTRKLLIRRLGQDYEGSLSGLAILRGTNYNSEVITVTSEYGEFDIPVPREDVKDKYDGKIGEILEFEVSAVITPSERIKRLISVGSVELVDPLISLERVMTRINELSHLKVGWLDGQGEAISLSSIKVAKNIVRILGAEYEDIRAYPMEDGGIQLEVETDDFDLSCEAWPDGSIVSHVLYSKDGREKELSVDGVDDRLMRFLLRPSVESDFAGGEG